MEWEQLKFDDQGLLPAVIQDEATNAVLMVAYMNKEALEKVAREKYLMKKENEDIFIFEEDK